MPWTNASIVLNSRDATSGQYNQLKFNAVNQNVVQGQIHSISVNELNFPYDIPNVQKGTTDSFNLSSTETDQVLVIEIPPGFYTGTELATAINDEIEAQAAASTPVIPTGHYPVVKYDDVSNLFSFEAPTVAPPTNPDPTWEITSPYTAPNGYPKPLPLGKDLLSMMGFLKSQAPLVVSSAPNEDPVLTAAQSAPLQFTQYVDICSPLLCQYQYFRDGSTTNLARRADVICRLYITNNVATQENEGERPFVIQRQFMNARVMRWSAESSVGQIDINLFDDVGQPLQTTWQPRPYQITFNCYEQDKDSTTY